MMANVRNNSAEVLEFVKRDLDEFSVVIKNEASTVVSSTTSAFKETLQLDKPESTANNVKRSVSSFLDQFSNVMNPPPDDADEEAIIMEGNNPVVLSRLQARLYALARDPNTFLTEVEEERIVEFNAWLDIAEEGNQFTVERVSKLLKMNPALQESYTTLVPHQVTHMLFWNRYLFRKALIEDEEALRQRRTEREEEAAESFQWENEKYFGDHIELTEEEQTRLLIDYEKEQCLVKEKCITSKVINIPPLSGVKTELKSKENEFNLPIVVREKKDLVIVGEINNEIISTSTSSKESTDGDWEKEFDNLDDTEAVDKQSNVL